MGHLRLGRLPKTQRWKEVVDLLGSAPEDTPAIAAAAIVAAERRLCGLRDDPSVTYCFWLLTRIAWASRGTQFAEELERLGVGVSENTPMLGFIARITDRVRAEVAPHTGSGHFSEIASLALRRALTETVEQFGPGLFGSSVADLQHAFRTGRSPM